MRFPLLAALACAGLAASARAQGVEPELWIELRSGRASAHCGAQPTELRVGRAFAAPRAGRVELALGARALLSFPGQASLELVGPLALGWRSDALAGPRLSLESGSGELQLEVRSAALRVELPQGFLLTAERGSASLDLLPAGAARLEHVGGQPLRLASLRERPAGSWRSRLTPGECVQLER